MQELSIVSSTPPIVQRPPGGQRVYLTFDGLRESRTVADKLTRVRVSLPLAELKGLCKAVAELTG